ncbi:MAG: type IV pili methyl-accepting chemotaxis transducer N-terminal domain-containing protein [Sulfurimonas sp.]|uniref:type IV pili methyl-accepting chemotaxis transducer N-terminal domain-containing protein n=1 Tax=Sulfurimonas sp. TaxID=2022749 RepID=UPI0025DBAA66|nr:type IV pili methyl-accepting chemotaxis transducer N-terminal domain-containing protein [Sulfurimonas sp.]MCK9454401.1 type IV pili methyl-accepting chemotaxis transducer N-terminal domain-containing protein [Sulfurimonas sp.]
MIKFNKISTKIKVIGALLILLVIGALGTTINLTQQNIKDALIINIAGKQRMLTQEISKTIFYTQYSKIYDFTETDKASAEFIEGLNTLKHGSKSKGISPLSTHEILTQLEKIEMLWQNFYADIQNYKLLSASEFKKEQEIKETINAIYEKNSVLLQNVDKLVTLYTNHSEHKTNFIKTFQYSAGVMLFIIFIYSFLQLRSIESHVDSFMQYSKMLADKEDISNLSPIELEAESESEIVEVSDTINSFINKINSAVEYSNEALLQSQKASSKLEELTDEFDTILGDLKDKSSACKHLDNSEDIAIASTEELMNSTKRLSNLKKELDELLKSCQLLKS